MNCRQRRSTGQTKATLYIETRELERWRVDSGAFVLKLKNKAEQYFPLYRLNKIVFIGSAKGELSQLQRVMESGVAVAFMDAQGGIKGLVYSSGMCLGELKHISETLRYDHLAQNQFELWLLLQQRHLQSLIDSPLTEEREQTPINYKAFAWLDALAKTQLWRQAADFDLTPGSKADHWLINRLHRLLTPWLLAQAQQQNLFARKMTIRNLVAGFQQIQTALEIQQKRVLIQLEGSGVQWL